MGKIKKNTKSKAKEKKELMMMPRLRLEPRLTPKPPKKSEDKQHKDGNNSVFLRISEIGENSTLSYSDFCEEMGHNYEQENRASHILNNSPASEDNINCISLTEDAQSSVYETETEEDDDWEKVTVKKRRKKHVQKKKAKGKKELKMVPKLKLKPRLAPKLSKKSEDKQNKKHSLRFLRADEIGQNSCQAASLHSDSCGEIRSDCEQESKASRMLNSNSAIAENTNCKAPTEDAESSKYESEDNGSCENITIKKPRKRHVRRNAHWNDRELMDLVIGLQSEGFADLKKVADYVKTKNENEIHLYLRKHSMEARKAENPNRQHGKLPYKWTTVSPENIATWPNVRKWRKLAYNQMLSHIRNKDYSKPIISALFKRFYEEEKEPADPQVINLKLIYKYMMDCMSGEIPAQLPPKESSLVLDLLREVRSMPIAYDFEEELKFLNDFKEATKFRPFQMKDEFKKRFKKAHDDDDDAVGPNTVSVPEEVFLDLSRHKRLIQSFNPLVTPVWMLQKEQELLEKYEESSVYVD